MIKAVLFDIDNTLLSFDGYVKEAMKNGFKGFGLCEYTDDMFDVFNETNNKLWQSIEKGELDFETLKKIRWNLIFERLGISADGIAFEKFFREYLFESAIVIDGAKKLLDYLRGKYLLCVASTGPFHQQVNRLKNGGLYDYFSHLFISEEIGFSKPSKQFFDTCIERLNASSSQKILPEEILIIGDSLSSDMLGGINAGIQTCFYNPKSTVLPPDTAVNYTVSSLAEIKNIL